MIYATENHCRYFMIDVILTKMATSNNSVLGNYEE